MFNKGFTAPKSKLVYSDDDMVLAPWPDTEHCNCDTDSLQHRTDRISNHNGLGQICLIHAKSQTKEASIPRTLKPPSIDYY